MKKWPFVVVPAAVAAPFLMSLSSMLCGCLPDGTYLHGMTGVYPMDVSPDEARKAYLSRMPVGTTEAAIIEKFAKMDESIFKRHCQPATAYSGYECKFEEREVASLFGKYREGFRIEIQFDAKRTLEDVRFARIERKI